MNFRNTIFFFILMAVWACGPKSSTKTEELSGEALGQSVFKNKCFICHGKDGRKGLGGAKPLPESTLSVAERIQIISQGKGKMMPYEGVLSPEEIKAVAEYTTTLK